METNFPYHVQDEEPQTESKAPQQILHAINGSITGANTVDEKDNPYVDDFTHWRNCKAFRLGSNLEFVKRDFDNEILVFSHTREIPCIFDMSSHFKVNTLFY